MPPGVPRSRSLTRLTMRVGLLHLGQSVDLVVSITFLRSPVFAILAMVRVFLLRGVSLLSSTEYCGNIAADGFNGAVVCSAFHRNWIAGRERTRFHQFTT